MTLETIEYRDGDVALSGRLVRPAGQPRGAILILPSIGNGNPAMEQRAQMLADAGFVAMVADFYGKPVPDDFDELLKMAGEVRATAEGYRRRLRAGLDTLAAAAPGLPMGAMGYCMGGQGALELARDGAPLVMVCSFHGILQTDAPASADRPITARVLVCHGDADPLVPHEQVLAFWAEMNAAGAQWHFHSYGGVKHGFTDPDSDARAMDFLGYDASADRQSWAALTSMLDEVFA